MRFVEGVDIGDVRDEVLACELLGEFFAQAFDVHRAAGREVLQQAFKLRGAG